MYVYSTNSPKIEWIFNLLTFKLWKPPRTVKDTDVIFCHKNSTESSLEGMIANAGHEMSQALLHPGERCGSRVTGRLEACPMYTLSKLERHG